MLFPRSASTRFFLFVIITFISMSVLADLNNKHGSENKLFKRLFDYAKLANAAYQGADQVTTKLATADYTLIKNGEIPGYGVSYYLATNDNLKQQVLILRGTSNVENALVDIAFKLLPNKHTGIMLHQGFAQAADFIYNEIKSSLNADYQFNATGHSLGGAVALIVAMYIDTDGFVTGEIITYGQPKVTNINGSRQFSHLDVTRVVMPKDLVPLVPPLDPIDMMNMDIYWHLGTEILLLQGNKYSELEGINSMMRATDFLGEMISEKNLQHHYMSLYIKSLAEKLEYPVRIPYKNNFNILDWFGNNKSVGQ